MDDVLRELLDTELQAEALVKEAQLKQEKLVREARARATDLAKQFEAGLPEVRKAEVGKADQRAEQAIAELRKRYIELERDLRSTAQARAERALKEAMETILQGDGV